jgi:cell division protein ZapA (FtsZ GTPase activity inhibitor)
MTRLVIAAVLLVATSAAAQEKVSDMERCRVYSVNIKQDRDNKEALLAEAMATITQLKAELAKLRKATDEKK